MRIGHGYDIHRIQPGGTLMLGGVKAADGFSAVAHSDGDVVLHAVVDALLGAIGGGDIGQRFPNTDPKWQNAPSRLFVERVMDEVRGGGWRVVNLDVTILAERPRIGVLRTEMVAQLVGLLDCQAVNIKAGTNEGCDAIGRGEAIAAHAVVLLGRSNGG